MGFLSDIVQYVWDRPLLILLGFALYTGIFLLSLLFSRPKPGPNPFLGDTRQPIKPMVHDKALRDKVLKQGFVSKRLPDSVDVIMIGSGIGGLTTAALLAKAGKKVLVLEQHDQAGGCCHTFVEDGFEFDVGIHYIGEKENRTLGRTLLEQISDGQIQWAPLDKNFDTVAIGPAGNAKMFPLEYGKDDLKRSLLKCFPDEKQALDKFFDQLARSRKSFLGFIMLKVLPYKLANVMWKTGILNLMTGFSSAAKLTTQEFLDSITNDQDLKAVLSYSFGDYATPPKESSMMMHALLWNHYSYSSSYPVGGASEIAFHIIPVIERHGGRVLVRAKVSDILFEKGRAVGVRVSKGSAPVEIRAKKIISDAGILNTLKMIPTEIAKKSRMDCLKNDSKIKNGYGGMNLFVGLRGTKEELGLAAHNLWAFSNNDLNASFHNYMAMNPATLDEIPEIPLLFVSFPSAKDPTWSERYPGKSVCTVVTMANYDWFSQWSNERVMHRGDSYDALKDTIGKKMWSQVLKFYPQLEDKVEYFNVASPITNDYYIASDKGEMYGLDHNKMRFDGDIAMKMRPETGIPRLYLTGQDILTCGFSGAMFGGLLCASAVLNRNLFDDCMKLHSSIKQKEKSAAVNVSNGDKKTL